MDETVSEEVLYIIEQYIDGVSLRDWINKKNKANLKFKKRVSSLKTLR